MNKELLIKELNNINVELTDIQIEQIEKFCEFMLQENKKYNLTAIKDLDSVYLKHVYDSLTLSRIIDLSKEQSILDIGSGAGFPGIILKIVFPNLKVTLLDSNNKKTSFLTSAIEALDLKNIDVVHSRAEEYIKTKREFFDIVTARAVTRLSVLMELAIPFVKVEGNFVAMKGSDLEEINEGLRLSNNFGCILEKQEQFNLPIENSERTLLNFRKKEKTKNIYPRNYSQIIKGLNK